MRLYLVSLSVGILVGAVYAMLGVRSPAPPIVALIGLLGMLAGEHAVEVARAHWAPPASGEPQP